MPGKGVWLKENATGAEAQIGIFDPDLDGTSNRMQPVAAGFEALGIPALQRCGASDNEWVAIDEIGYLESEVPAYCAAVTELLAKKRVVASVRKQDTPFLSSLMTREDVFLLDLDAPFGNIGCVIMASGLGRRFGGNKLMADFHGKPMIDRCLAATADVPRRVVVTRYSEVAEYCLENGVQPVLHDLPYRSDTVRLGVQALADTDACLFCPADQPLLSRNTVDALMLSSAAVPGKIWRPSFENEPGAPVLFPSWTYNDLAALPQGKGGGYVVKKNPERVCTIPARDMYELKDVDTPEDLRVLLDR